jgi:hypothetical protein
VTEPKNTPPYKNPVFWMLVALIATIAISYPLLWPTSGSLMQQVVPSLFLFALAVTIIWFRVKREMSRRTTPIPKAGIVRGLVVVLVFILFFVVLLLKKYL